MIFLFLILIFSLQADPIDYLRTEQDHVLWNSFQEKKGEKEENLSIPKLLHFVWFGPTSEDQKISQNIEKWKKFYPDWKIHVWTDRDRHFNEETHQLEDFSFQFLEDTFFQLTDPIERSYLFLSEVLFALGGIGVDPRLEPKKSLQPLQEEQSFFTFLNPLGPSYLSSNVFAVPYLLGTAPAHPIIKQWMLVLKERMLILDKGVGENFQIHRFHHGIIQGLNDSILKSSASVLIQPFYDNYAVFSKCKKNTETGFLKNVLFLQKKIQLLLVASIIILLTDLFWLFRKKKKCA